MSVNPGSNISHSADSCQS